MYSSILTLKLILATFGMICLKEAETQQTIDSVIFNVESDTSIEDNYKRKLEGLTLMECGGECNSDSNCNSWAYGPTGSNCNSWAYGPSGSNCNICYMQVTPAATSGAVANVYVFHDPGKIVNCRSITRYNTIRLDTIYSLLSILQGHRMENIFAQF